MRQVTVVITTTAPAPGTGDPMPVNVMASSSEPDNANGGGDGNTTGDVAGGDGFTAPVDLTSLFTWDPDAGSDGAWVGTIDLCAERASNGVGRIYTIDITDPAGGSGPLAGAEVAVPRSNNGRSK